MEHSNRGFLVLSRNIAFADELTIKHQLACLHKMINEAETLRSLCYANEIIDVNRCKVISKPQKVQPYVIQHKLKPFVFIFCKN